MEFILIGVLGFWILQVRGKVDGNKFIKDGGRTLDFLKEDDYAFYVKAKYGENVDIDTLFDLRIRNGLISFVVFYLYFNIT